MATRKRYPKEQLYLFDEITLRSLEYQPTIWQGVPEPEPGLAEMLAVAVSNDLAYFTVGPIHLGALKDIGYRWLESVVSGKARKPARPPTKTKQSVYASKRVKGRPEI